MVSLLLKIITLRFSHTTNSSSFTTKYNKMLLYTIITTKVKKISFRFVQLISLSYVCLFKIYLILNIIINNVPYVDTYFTDKEGICHDNFIPCPGNNINPSFLYRCRPTVARFDLQNIRYCTVKMDQI